MHQLAQSGQTSLISTLLRYLYLSLHETKRKANIINIIITIADGMYVRTYIGTEFSICRYCR